MDVVIAGVKFDAKQRRLQKGDDFRHLEPKVFSLLSVLAAANGALVTRDELIEQVWQGRIVGEGAINRAMSLLRGHFSALSCENIIETVPTQGYRLIAEITSAGGTDVPDVAATDISPGGEDAPAEPADNPLPLQPASRSGRKSFFKVFFPVMFLFVLALLIWRLIPGSGGQLPLSLVGEPIISLEGWQHNVSASTDGALILYHHRGRDNQDRVYLYNSQNHETRLILKDARATLSPDGSKVVYFEEEEGTCLVRLYMLASQESQTLFQCRKWPSRLIWGKENQIYYNERISKSYPYQVFSFDINTRAIRQLTLPKGDSNLKGDFDFAYNPVTRELAVLRYKNEQESELLLFSGSGREQQTPAVHSLAVKARTLAWLPDKGELVLASADRLYTFDPLKGRLNLAGQAGAKINSLAVVSASGQEQILVSETRVASDILRHDLNTGTDTLWQTSSRLELLPRIAQGRAALISTRHQSHKLWLAEGGRSRPLELDLPFELEFSRYEFSADGQKILLSKLGAVFEIDIEQLSYSQLLPESAQAYVVNYGDSNDVIYSSTRSGQWQLWQYRRDTGEHRQLTTGGGYSGRVKEGQLYFSKFNRDGLWRKPMAEPENNRDEAQLMIEDFPRINWLNWQLIGNNLYFYRPDSGIWQYHLPDKQEKPVMVKPDNFIHQFALSPDQQQLYWVKQKPVTGDIYRFLAFQD